MGTQRHVVKRMTFTVTLAREADAWPLQEALSRLQRQRVEPLLERCFSEASPADRLHRIGRLELDLGRIGRDRLEAELPERLERALRESLTEAIDRLEAQPAARSPRIDSCLELLAHFAHHGSLSWWADRTRSGLPAECFDTLAREAPERLAGWLAHLARREAELRRLIRHFDDRRLALLAALALAISPEEAHARYLELRAVFEAQPALSRGSAADARLALWQALLQTAGDRAGALREWPDFGQAVLARWAGLAGLPLATLAESWRRLQSPAKATGPSDLRNLAEAPDAEGAQPAAADARAGVPAPPQASGDAEDTGPVGNSGSNADHGLFTAGNERGKSASAASADEPDAGWAGGSPLPADPASPWPKRPAASPWSEPDEADAHYLDNAGLVVLWPFLGHFFQRLGLASDSRFPDDGAACRGAGLLQTAASGDPAPPEYLLPLNKLLCGLAPDAPFALDAPATAEEQDECGLLLDAVSEQAPILKGLSRDGLRGSFLLRPGILALYEDFWLLRVERRTHDAVLDRLPWGFEWVKLPWMAVPLRVEW